MVVLKTGRAGTRAIDGPAAPAIRARRLPSFQPKTMVEQAAEAVVAAAVRGAFLPGDRLVEAEIARDLGISRVPVREALRLLESQGIVVSQPYKGMRLMQLSNRSVAELMQVRLALETLAVEEAVRAGGKTRFDAVVAAQQAHASLPANADAAERVAANQRFHLEICHAADNATLSALWCSLSRQLAVVWGLAQSALDPAEVTAEHAEIIANLRAGDVRAAAASLALHIQWHARHDYEAAIRQRRAPVPED